MPYKDKENRKKYIKQYMRKYRLDIENREKEKECDKRYHQINSEKEKEYKRQYYIKNRDEILERTYRYKKNNSGKIKSGWKRYYKNNREEINKKNKQYRENNIEKERERRIQYYKNNPEKMKEYHRKYNKSKYKSDIKFNLNRKISTAVGVSIKSSKNGRHWEELVDFTLSDLIKYLKKTIPKGYTWQDYINGVLELDHKLPISAFNFTKPEHTDFKKCWALSNLQLLPKSENRIKHNKLSKPFQPALAI